MYLFKLVFLFPLNKYPDVKLLDQTVDLFLIFEETSYYFTIVVIQIYIPTQSAQGFSSIHILITISISCFLMIAIPTNVGEMSLWL